MPTITSRVHPGTVSSVLRLVADRTAGIWDLSSLAFTIPTGLAGRRTTTLSSLPALRTCYGPPYLSAQGQSRDLQHSSPILARCGNIALRDIAHMVIRPVNTGIPHEKRSSLHTWFLSTRALILWRQTARLSHHRFRSGTVPGKCELSQSVEPGGATRLSPSAFNSCREPVYPCSGPLSRGLVLRLMYKEKQHHEAGRFYLLALIHYASASDRLLSSGLRQRSQPA
jgi:hypothetical protein